MKFSYLTLTFLLLLSWQSHAQDNFLTTDPPARERVLVKGKIRLKDAFIKNIGSIYMSVMLKNDKITVLNVGAKIIFRKPTPTSIEHLMSGKSKDIHFSPNSSVALKIHPWAGFTPEGGTLDLDIITTKGVFRERIVIAKRNGVYKAYKWSIAPKNELLNLSVQLKGKLRNIDGFKIYSYRLDTRK